jgi:hypothetical protein
VQSYCLSGGGQLCSMRRLPGRQMRLEAMRIAPALHVGAHGKLGEHKLAVAFARTHARFMFP